MARLQTPSRRTIRRSMTVRDSSRTSRSGRSPPITIVIPRRNQIPLRRLRPLRPSSPLLWLPFPCRLGRRQLQRRPTTGERSRPRRPRRHPKRLRQPHQRPKRHRRLLLLRSRRSSQLLNRIPQLRHRNKALLHRTTLPRPRSPRLKRRHLPRHRQQTETFRQRSRLRLPHHRRPRLRQLRSRPRQKALPPRPHPGRATRRRPARPQRTAVCPRRYPRLLLPHLQQQTRQRNRQSRQIPRRPNRLRRHRRPPHLPRHPMHPAIHLRPQRTPVRPRRTPMRQPPPLPHRISQQPRPRRHPPQTARP